jgi:hypothetical protein
LVGYSILHERLQTHQESIRQVLGDHEYATEEFQDTCSMIYKHLSNRDYSPVSMSPIMKQGDIKRRVVDGGQNTLLHGRQSVVSAYVYWEEYLRIEVGKALGVLPPAARASEKTMQVLNKHVVSDFWGDTLGAVTRPLWEQLPCPFGSAWTGSSANSPRPSRLRSGAMPSSSPKAENSLALA